MSKADDKLGLLLCISIYPIKCSQQQVYLFFYVIYALYDNLLCFLLSSSLNFKLIMPGFCWYSLKSS